MQTWTIQRIPKQIFHIGLYPSKHVATWKTLNPEYVVKFLNDGDCKTLVTEYNDFNITRAYTAASVGVIRADLCRLLVLIVRGGFYVDSDVVMTAPLRTVVPSDATMFSTEWYSFEFFGAIPDHPFITHALKTSTQNILNEVNRCQTERLCCRGSHKCVIEITGPASYFRSNVRVSQFYGCTNKKWVPSRTQCSHARTPTIQKIYKCIDTGLRHNAYRTTFCGIARHMDCRNSGAKKNCHANHYSKSKHFYNYTW